ncbi:MAG: Ig-like domain-containing protein, partial [Muribaculaceae bacterium]|nr:Ig-like domain-containing protein [Muribaculaceae bacterium]
LLSEGGFHTIASQQQRNLNGDYRRLEALAAFQSLLEYHGVDRPDMTFLHGVVTNSENDQPINGATVTVDGKTYTTDTYESLFHKYSNNPNLIHNGLYTFEGLEAGKEYTVTFEAPGFESKTATVTIKAGGTKTVDYVTYLDMALTNTAPAKIDAVSVENPTAVSPLYPIEITFSRNMDRESVEKAFSINNDGEVELKWINDYTLSVDIANLLPLWDYTITIDGSVAKNSQTNQLFDGDADGQPGGNWTYSFTMAEPDVTAPEVVSTFPANDGEVQLYSTFPIRFELDEILNWNDDKNGECIVVTDSDGKEIKGKIVHAIVREQSVIHFYADEAYPKDKTILAELKPGLTDLSGNVTENSTYVRFMTEYRPIETTVIQQCANETGFWAPGGSGSSSGLVTDECSTPSMPVNPFSATGTSMSMNYVFDEANASENWFVRLYTPNTNQYYSKDFDVVLSYWMYSDGSNNAMNMMVRIPNSSGGLKYKAESLTLDFRGWNMFSWDFKNDEYSHFTGDQVLGESGNWRFDSFTMKHEYTDPDDEDVPQQAWTGSIGLYEMAAHKVGEAERQAKLDDIKIPTAVEDVVADNLKVNVGVDMITIVSDSKVLSATVTAVNGMSVAKVNGSANILTVSTAALAPGVYVVSVVTEEGTKTVKFVK